MPNGRRRSSSLPSPAVHLILNVYRTGAFASKRSLEISLLLGFLLQQGEGDLCQCQFLT